MTNVAVSDAYIEVVHFGASGSNAKVSDLALEVVTDYIAKFAELSMAYLEVIHNGATGAIGELSASFMEVINTTGAPNNTRQFCWGFTLDSHPCYCLDLGANGTLIFDVSTGEWYHFDTYGYGGHWNMKIGFEWVDGKKIVAGDITSGKAWYVDKNSFYDDGWKPMQCEMRGVLFNDTNDYKSQYTLKLIGSSGLNMDDIDPIVQMQYSDDQGATWSDVYEVALTTDTKQRVEWTSLGSFASPGRIFKITSTGGAKFIGRVIADVDE